MYSLLHFSISDLGINCQYTEIWALDEKDPFMPPDGGESVADVASRLSTALASIEAMFQGYQCLNFSLFMMIKLDLMFIFLTGR